MPPVALAHGARGAHFASSRSGSAFVQRRIPSAPKSVFPQPVDPWKFWGVPPVHKHFNGGFHGSFVGTGGFIGTPSVVVAPPAAPDYFIDAPSVVVYAPSPAAAGAVPTAAPSFPTPMLVEHADGWYQLRGDGVSTPYKWVWIPKPPVTPAVASEPGPPAADAQARARDPRGPAYHWTDDRGVTTFTNKLERVPKRFRDQAAAAAAESD